MRGGLRPPLATQRRAPSHPRVMIHYVLAYCFSGFGPHQLFQLSAAFVFVSACLIVVLCLMSCLLLCIVLLCYVFVNVVLVLFFTTLRNRPASGRTCKPPWCQALWNLGVFEVSEALALSIWGFYRIFTSCNFRKPLNV